MPSANSDGGRARSAQTALGPCFEVRATEGEIPFESGRVAGVGARLGGGQRACRLSSARLCFGHTCPPREVLGERLSLHGLAFLCQVANRGVWGRSVTRPLSGWSRPARILSSVVLPTPLGPRTPSLVPAPTERLTVSRIVRTPWYLVTPRATSAAAPWVGAPCVAAPCVAAPCVGARVVEPVMALRALRAFGIFVPKVRRTVGEARSEDQIRTGQGYRRGPTAGARRPTGTPGGRRSAGTPGGRRSAGTAVSACY